MATVLICSNKQNYSLFDIVEKDGFLYIFIPYELRKEFKIMFPDGNWDSASKCWLVPKCQEIKLLEGVEYFKSLDEYPVLFKKHEELRRSLRTSKKLIGKTYEIRSQLEEKYNAFFYNYKMRVHVGLYEEAQKFVDRHTEYINEKSKRNHIIHCDYPLYEIEYDE